VAPVAPASPLPPPQPGTYLFAGDFTGVSVGLAVAELRYAGSVVSADGRRAYEIDRQGREKALVVRDIPSLEVVRRFGLDHVWSLPEVTQTFGALRGELGGLSANGRWLVLWGGLQGSSETRSRFLVVDTTFSRPARDVSIPGNFYFDAISDDGNGLFLIERQARNTYSVRVYDVARGKLGSENLVDKSAPNEVMRGMRTDSVAGAQGTWLYSAYADTGGKAFIHALGVGLGQPYAHCIDLPRSSLGYWKLALGKDRLYAFSEPDGLLAELQVAEPPRVMRTLTLPRATAWRNPFWVDAMAKEMPGSRPALAPDGRTLYLVRDRVVWAIDTQSLSVRSRLLEGSNPISVAVDADGWLYATSTTSVGVLRVDPRTGDVAERLAGGIGAPLLRVLAIR
jgi:hypothetical protein